jgi:hypothetical protein
VTYDRATRKDEFYWYKANWSNQRTVYITERRYNPRPGLLELAGMADRDGARDIGSPESRALQHAAGLLLDRRA